MIIKKLDSDYWYVRISGERFAQWPTSRRCTREDCHPYAWWTEADVQKVNVAIDDQLAQECKAWKQTPEGQEWTARRAALD